MVFRDFLLGACLGFIFLGIMHAYITNARLRLLEAQHREVVIENAFLARKLGESHFACMDGLSQRDLSLQLAVSGFRSGSWFAYDSIVREARRNLAGQAGVAYVR